MLQIGTDFTKLLNGWLVIVVGTSLSDSREYSLRYFISRGNNPDQLTSSLIGWDIDRFVYITINARYNCFAKFKPFKVYVIFIYLTK